MKKSEKKGIVILVVLGLAVFGVLGYKIYIDFIKDNSVKVKQLDSIDLFGYTLSDTDSAYYKENFKLLAGVLKEKTVDYKEYAKYLSILYIIDFYSLNSKVTATDIGGLEFVHSDLIENFKLNAGSSIYKGIESNVDGKRKQKLPEVKNVLVNEVNEDNYEYNDEDYTSYEVKATITYNEELEYPTEVKLIMIKDNNKLLLVEGE